jgi:hypothetical protein
VVSGAELRSRNVSLMGVVEDRKASTALSRLARSAGFFSKTKCSLSAVVSGAELRSRSVCIISMVGDRKTSTALSRLARSAWFFSKTKCSLSVVEVLPPRCKILYYAILTLNRTFSAMKGNHHERIHLYTSL